MKRAVFTLALASVLPVAGQNNSTSGQDQSGTTAPKYKKKRAKVHPTRGTTASDNQDVPPKPAGAPGSSTAAPAPNPANPADPTLPTTTKGPAK